MDKTFERVQKVLVEVMGCDESEVTPNANLDVDLGTDSLDTVEIVMGLEEEFNVELPDDDCFELTTVQQLIDLVKKHTAA